MRRAVIGLFETYEDANEAVSNLVEAGYPSDTLSLLVQPEVVEELLDQDKNEVVAESAGAGAVGGTALGTLLGLLAGASVVSLPLVGPALAAGALANLLGVTAAGAGVGAAYGGIMGALVGLGIAEEDSHVYVEGVKNGGLLVVVDTAAERTGRAEEIMRRADAVAAGVYHRPLQDESSAEEA